MAITYAAFWGSFYKDTAFQRIFEYVLSDIPQKKLICDTHVLFSSEEEKAKIIPPGFKGVFVTYSGEPYYIYSENSINLNMSPNKALNTIPMQLFSITAYITNTWPRLQKRYISPLRDRHTRFCSFVVANGKVHTRNRFMEKLSEYKRVDSYGAFMNNTGIRAPGSHTGDPEYWDFLGKHKFNLCFENANQQNYITEKLLNSYLAGSIPVYWGTNQALSWFNPRAFLYLEDETEEAMDRLIEKIKRYDNDATLYSEMLAQPLMIGEIPEEMTIETWRRKAKTVYESPTINCQY